MEYKEFQKKFRAETKANGGKITMKSLNKAWKLHKKEEKKNAKITKLSENNNKHPTNSEVAKENREVAKERIEIQKQATEIMQLQSPPSEPVIATETVESSTPLPAPTAIISQPVDDIKKEEMYTAISDSVHTALGGIISLLTEKKVQVEREKIERLNKCGVLLLKKYDTSGQILEYSPEIAYVLTLADIGSQVYIEMKRRTPKPTPEPTLPTLATNNKQEVGDFNSLITKAGK